MQNNNKKYFAPEIKLILIDNDISLALESSSPPIGPSEAKNTAPEYFDINPYNIGLA